MTEELRALVRGEVQGVGFRAATVREARRWALKGTASNRPDGSVEIIAQGPRDDLEAFVRWIGMDAPGQVSSIDTQYGPITQPKQSFDAL
jgi:acylphosphatase